jgi:hypothetical protein
VGIRCIIRIQANRLAVTFGGLAILLQVIASESDIEIRLGGGPETYCLPGSFDGLTVTAQFLAAESGLGPGLSVVSVRLYRFLEVRESFLTIVLRKKTESVAKELDRFCALVIARSRYQVGE